MPATQSAELLDALKRVAAVLRDAGVPFALGGGLAAWARGGPPTEKDIDLLIREGDCDMTLKALADAGYRTEVPPEGWLVKAYDGDVLIDLIHHPSGFAVDDELLDRCDVLSVYALSMRVIPVIDLLTSKLLALTEHHLDYAPALEISRSLREQIDWTELGRRTSHSPFARAFLSLACELGVIDIAAAAPRPR